MKRLLLILLVTIIFLNVTGQITQFPQVYYNGQGTGGFNLNIRQSASSSATVITSFSTTSKIGAVGIVNNSGDPNFMNWVQVCLPSTSGVVTYGFVACDEYYARINETNNCATVTTTSLNIRTGAGTTFSNVTIGGTAATFGNSSIIALTGSSSTVSGIVWYQVHLTTNCSQSTGWVSSGTGSTLLSINSNTTNYRNVGGRICNGASNCNIVGNINGATLNFSGFGSTFSSGTFYQFKLPVNWSGSITCTHPSYNSSSPTSYSYTASSHNYLMNFVLSSCTPISSNYIVSNQTVTAPSSASFSVSATGTSIIYQWQYSSNGGSTWNNAAGSPYSGETTSTLTVNPTATNMSGYFFRCYLYNNCTSITYTNWATLTVNAGCTPITSSYIVNNQTVTAPSAASFNISATGTSITYQWQYSTNGGSTWNNATGSPYSGGATSTLTINPTATSMNGYQYRCYLFNNCTSTTYTSWATLNVNSSCTFSINPTSNNSVPANGANNLNVAVTTQSGCAWSSSNNGISWITASSSGTGNGTALYSVALNPDPTPRSGTITIAGQNFAITQAGSTPIPTINSITFTNKIENHSGITPLYTLYSGSAFITNNSIKICADGSTATFIKINASNTVGITFRILNGNTPINNPEIYGELGTPIIFGNNIEVPYTHPKYMSLTSLSRSLNLEVLFNGSPINGISFPLEIYRTPVMFVHGLWGGITSFEKMYNNFKNTSFLTEKLMLRVDYNQGDYKGAARSFSDNSYVIYQNINQLLLQARANNFSTSKVDIVAHSMGCILSRLYLTDKNPHHYRYDVNKFIAIDGPFGGTQSANLLLSPWADESRTLLEFIGNPTGLGAVENLRVNSAATANLNNQPLNKYHIPTYTLKNHIQFDDAGLFDGNKDKFLIQQTYSFRKCDYIAKFGIQSPQELLNYIYFGDNSDLIVPIISQVGGVTKYNSINYPNVHTATKDDDQLINHIKNKLIQSPQDNTLFDTNGYAPILLDYQTSFDQPFQNPLNCFGLQTPHIYINSPANNSTVLNNDSIHLNISTDQPINNIKFKIFNSYYEIITIDTFSSSLNSVIPIPNNVCGKFFIVAAGYDSLNYVNFDTVKFFIAPSASLDSIQVNPDSIYLPANSYSSIRVYGYYPNAVVLDISDLPGITYSIMDTLIAKFRVANVIQGKDSGLTSASINYLGKSAQTQIRVYSDVTWGMASFSSSTDRVCTGSTISFHNNSTLNPTSLAWLFPGGTPTSSNLSDPIITYGAAGNFSVTLIASYPDKNDTLELPNFITISESPTANAGSSNTICTGTPYTLTGAGIGGAATNGTWTITGATGTMTNNASQLNFTNATASPDTVKFTPIAGHKGTVTLKLTTDNPIGPCDSVSSTIVLTVNGYTWYGAANTSWTNGANWSSCGIPPSGADLTIATTGSNPTLPASINVGNLTLNAGTVLQLGGYTLTVNGAIIGAGKIIGSPTSSLVITGAGGTLNFDQTNADSRSLNNLTLNNGASASLGDSMNIYGTIELTSATFHLAGKSLTLKSTDINTARIADLTNSTLDGANNVTMERFIKLRSPGTGYGTGNNGRAYRLLAPTVNTSGHPTKASLKSNWMEGSMNTAIGTNINPAPTYGTQITGPGGNTNGFDVTQSNASSLYSVSNAIVPTYTAVGNTNGTLNPLAGYFLYVRGDRSMNMQIPLAPGMPTSSTTLRTTGTLLQGTQTTFNNQLVGGGAQNLVTNPYPSPIDWNLVYAACSNLTTSYTFWDPNFGTRGGFVTVNTAGVASSGQANRFIQSGQAFFVESNNIGTPTVSIQESHKTAGNNNEVFFTPPPPVEAFRIELYFNEPNAYRRVTDGAIALFNNSYSAAVDADDAKEVNNWDENIAIVREGKHLAIESRPVIIAKDTIPLFMNNMRQLAYEFEFTPSMFTNPNLKAELIDNFNNTRTLLSVTAPTVVGFLITTDPASSASDRFKVVFGSFGGPLGVDVITIAANKKNTGVKVDWVSKTEKDMDSYELERSLDGSSFIKQNTTAATGNSSSPVNYSWFDALPLSGNNFYRVKGIDKFGSNRYSSIVKVLFGKDVEGIIAYPNPVTRGTTKIEFTEMLKGEYNLRLVNMLGQVIFNKQITHNGGNATHEIYFNKVTRGVYNLVIVKPDRSSWTKKLMIVD